MNNTNTTSNQYQNIYFFFGIILVISIPVYILASQVPQDMVILTGLLMTIAPITAGLILVYRENGSMGIKQLLRRTVDFKRIINKTWYLFILFYWPAIFLIAYIASISIGEIMPEALFPVIFTPVILVLFFIFSIFEEVGWMGYAFDPLESHWNALIASLVLGVLWAIWHLPLYILSGQETLWVASQVISLVAIRVLIVFIFNNTGKSVFTTILFHTVYNVCALMVTSFYISSGHLITSILITFTALSVIFLFDADTLTQIKFKKKNNKIEIEQCYRP